MAKFLLIFWPYTIFLLMSGIIYGFLRIFYSSMTVCFGIMPNVSMVMKKNF